MKSFRDFYKVYLVFIDASWEKILIYPGSILATKIPLVVLSWNDLDDINDVSDYAILPVGARVFVVETNDETLKVMAHDQVWYCDVGKDHGGFDATFDIVYEATDAL